MNDATVRRGSRLLTLAAFLTFVAWLAGRHPLILLVAVGFGVAAYALFVADQRRNPVELGRGGVADVKDRVGEGSETAMSPGVSVGGIHLSFEWRSRWRSRR